VQVKTTTYRSQGVDAVTISTSRGKERVAYDVDDLDHFFILTGRSTHT